MSSETDRPGASADKQPCDRQMMSLKSRLSMEEVRVLQECSRESFYYRSVPLAVTAMVATQIAVTRGLLKSNPRWGSVLKVIGAGFTGWLIGKISYRSACEEKFLQLKNSQLGDMIRKKRGYSLETFKDSPSDDSLPLFADNAPTYTVDDDFTSSSRSLNLDTDKNIQYSGLDDSERSTGIGDYDLQPEDKTPKFNTTYNDLRRKNREEYESRQSKLFQPPPTSSFVPPLSSTSKDHRNLEDKPQTRQTSHPSESSGFQNIYGDRWEK